jgi:hypothetical protein
MIPGPTDSIRRRIQSPTMPPVMMHSSGKHWRRVTMELACAYPGMDTIRKAVLATGLGRDERGLGLDRMDRMTGCSPPGFLLRDHPVNPVHPQPSGSCHSGEFRPSQLNCFPIPSPFIGTDTSTPRRARCQAVGHPMVEAHFPVRRRPQLETEHVAEFGHPQAPEFGPWKVPPIDAGCRWNPGPAVRPENRE